MIHYHRTFNFNIKKKKVTGWADTGSLEGSLQVNSILYKSFFMFKGENLSDEEYDDDPFADEYGFIK